jgi:branched-chain amino acid transport system substrate-binding protein
MRTSPNSTLDALARLATSLLLFALLLAGCGGDDEQESTVTGPLTVYTSVPSVGPSADEANAVVAGERLALDERRGRAGGREVRLVVLDSAKAGDASWNPDIARSNADKAADDTSAIAYIGELDFGGSAISVPRTNEAGLLQVSPYDGLTELTQKQPGARTGPERFYPRGVRNFVRLVPTDLEQAAALVSWVRAEGGSSIAILHDDHIFGRELASQVAGLAASQGMAVTKVDAVRPKDDGYDDLAADLAKDSPDAVLYTGIAPEVAGPLYDSLERGLPQATLFGSSGVASSSFETDARVHVVDAARPPSMYPAAGRHVLRRLDRRAQRRVPVEALYGYEAMQLVLDAIQQAGADGTDRADVVRAALTPRRRSGAIGRYAITRSGDVSEGRFAGYLHTGRRLRFEGMRGADAG